MQDEVRNNDGQSSDNDAADLPDIAVPTPSASNAIVPVDGERDDPAIAAMPEMPDTEAMIEEITARATDPDRNPNVRDDDRPGVDRDKDGRPDPTATPTSGKKKNARNVRKTPTPTSRSGRDKDKDDDKNSPGIRPGGPGAGNDADCPFSSLPENMQPKDFPFDDCQD